LDFGLAFVAEEGAKDAPRLTGRNEVNGTPHYMSPEQCKGLQVDDRSDVYSVGVMLYELLAADVPFDGQTSLDVMVQHLYVAPPPIAERGVRRSVPAEVERLVRWAMHKDPMQRPAIGELRRGLQGVLTQPVRDLPLVPTSRGGLVRDSGTVVHKEHSERGIARISDEALDPTAVAMQPATEQKAQVALWLVPQERLDGLRTSLSVHGLAVESWSALPTDHQSKLPAAIITVGSPDAPERVAMLRRHPQLRHLPVLVLEVPEVEQTPLLIRAGASDVILHGQSEDLICRKVWRLVRRGR
jgi:serine/threonine protein kinase